MIAWKNTDTLASYQELLNAERVELVSAMSGENGAERVKNYSVPMGEDMAFNFAARPVNADILAKLAAFAKEAQMTEIYARHRDALVTESVYSLKQCAIAAATHHNAVGGLLARHVTINFFTLDLHAENTFDDLRKLLIYCEVEAVVADQSHQSSQIFYRMCDLWSRKKYDFHTCKEKNK